jgi:hypothetical protein
MERTLLRDEMNGSMFGLEVVKIGGKVVDICVILLDMGADVGVTDSEATQKPRNSVPGDWKLRH